ncbi:2-oxo-4-hydroxy-4-carboxy-5-ureidoimidazoline decarboxylase [Endozoicomonas ascidiicola]|uniref:2-oxo-4-hydroxy-4-carboxy-5-ureidoimidazoline decarboxylase n=1 Tax=Endozoicomonas ascidiicola TaxID=1698521 RepID=UPI0008313D06|nr:2-oxo-4-hydroxy-4-carboxy-5-ureidoimidazoline decarboxylase [Endozoicomonas ascidiicola]
MTLSDLNTLAVVDASSLFRQCCASERWVKGMVQSRPFANVEGLLTVADELWAKCDQSDFLQAFDGHPKIGDVSSLKEKYGNTQQMAGHEQSGVKAANDDVLQALAEGNKEYEARFGYIFIVCATGKSADEMLGLLQSRLINNVGEELVVAAAEQHKITRIRLNKLVTLPASISEA